MRKLLLASIRNVSTKYETISAAFLDVKRNSQGYNEEVSSVDRDATKKLLRPFHIPQIGPSSIPQCHHLGTMM